MTIRKVSYLQGTVPSPYKLPAEDHRLNLAALWTPEVGSLGLRVRSGIVAGPGSPGGCTVVAGGVNINPFHVVIQGSITTTQGVYEFVSDAVEFRAITAASATEFRRGYVIARVYDQLNPGTGTVQDLPAIEVIYGPNAASAGAAQLPALPANSFVLREFAVSNTGAITLTATLPAFVVPRGGIRPSYLWEQDVTAGSYVGQYRDHATLGLQRWNGTAWKSAAINPVAAADVVAGEWVGQYRDHATLGLQRWDGAAWRAPAGKRYTYRSPALGSIPVTEVAAELREWGGRIYTPFGGLSYCVAAVDYTAAGFTEVPEIFVGIGTSNSYSLYGGYDQATAASCIVVIRAGVNIAGGTEISFMARGR